MFRFSYSSPLLPTLRSQDPYRFFELSMCVLVAQVCPTLCDPMDCSPPGSSVHGILQAKILEWVAISFSRRSSQPRDWTLVSCIAGRSFTSEPPVKPRAYWGPQIKNSDAIWDQITWILVLIARNCLINSFFSLCELIYPPTNEWFKSRNALNVITTCEVVSPSLLRVSRPRRHQISSTLLTRRRGTCKLDCFNVHRCHFSPLRTIVIYPHSTSGNKWIGSRNRSMAAKALEVNLRLRAKGNSVSGKWNQYVIVNVF